MDYSKVLYALYEVIEDRKKESAGGFLYKLPYGKRYRQDT